MTVLITGATGYIGSAVVRVLLEKGEDVRCLVRQTSKLKNLEGLEVELTFGDICDIESLRHALKDCETVYHLAALYANWLPNPGRMYQVNEEGTRNVLSYAKYWCVPSRCCVNASPWSPTTTTSVLRASFSAASRSIRRPIC